ncbi:hypothetical protein [Peribacillus deserti]|uniref:Uncharacterized protein n=1 Tax=Peribacillus deserti TaxID=673318 RepID=A0A2N5M1C5_9BACI|nr:hypothetical protein [Peribacillus deserti]PLT28161.1 hypothetical protein CUU66_19640 [Peribacillus deserti]
MVYRELIKSKSQEFRNVLSSFKNLGLKDTGSAGNCSFIKTYNKVTYKKTGQGRFRIGKITDRLDKNHMIIRLDLPKDEFFDEFLMKSTGFMEVIPRKQRTNFTCLKVHRASWDQTVFDTIDIKLYEEDIATFNLTSSSFLNFMSLLILRATDEIIEIPKN